MAGFGSAVLAVMLTGTPDAAAHEIPTDVKLNAFVKPAGNRLELLIRVPMAALVEVEFPLRGPGYIEMSRLDEALRSAAKLYLTDNITVYENGCAAADAADRSAADFAAIRQVVRVV